MGGRGGSSGIITKNVDGKHKQDWDKRFKRYDVQGEIIYKTSPANYIIYSYETDNISSIHKTLREAKEVISSGITARNREIERIKKNISDGKASESEKNLLAKFKKRESERRKRLK